MCTIEFSAVLYPDHPIEIDELVDEWTPELLLTSGNMVSAVVALLNSMVLLVCLCAVDTLLD